MMTYGSWLKTALLFVLGFWGIILRDTLFNQWSIAGGKPDFILILTVFYAIFNGYKKGAAFGMGIGLLEDLMAGRFIGVNMICKGLVGLVFGTMQKSLYKDNFLVPLICMLLASLLNSLVYFVLCLMIGSNVYFSGMVLAAIPDAIYTMCFAPVLYVIIYVLNRHKDEEE